MNAEALNDCNKRHLAKLAKEKGIAGWHAMRKDQLIRALSTRDLSAHQRKKKASKRRWPPGARRRGLAESPGRGKTPIAPATPTQTLDHACQKDRIIVLTRDSYWLHAYWELSPHDPGARPGPHSAKTGMRPGRSRVMDVSSEDTTSAAERHVRDISIHGGVNNWYIDVLEPPRSYRIDIGYLSRRGRFYVLARSNVVTTPKAGVTDALDENWSNVQKHFERIHNPSSNGNGNGTTHHNAQIDLRDLFEERLRRPMSSATLQNLATTALPHLGREFHFQIDAELIVYGTTEPHAKVTLQGEPVSYAAMERLPFATACRIRARSSRRSRPCRRNGGANDRLGRGTEHQRTRADDSRR